MNATPSPEVEIRPFTSSEIPVFTAWFNALPSNHVWTDEFVRSRTVDDPAYDAELMLVALHEGEPAGFLLGSLANGAGWIRAFIVHPNLRRQGIGSRLFSVFEQTLRDRRIVDITVGWAIPRYFLPGIDVAYTSAIVFLERLGYQTDRAARVNMDVELAGQGFSTSGHEAILRAKGVTVRRAASGDAERIYALCESQDHAGWVAETAMGLQRRPPTLHIALKDGRVIAFAAHSICGPRHFGPMLTDAGLRGLGIGSVLLKRCLLDWQRQGLTRCEISWTGPIPFYARAVGATMGRVFWSFHKSLQDEDA